MRWRVFAGSMILVAAAHVSSARAQGQGASFIDTFHADLRKRAEGIGTAEQRACAADIEKKTRTKDVRIMSWTHDLDVITNVNAGGWPARTHDPRYYKTLVIMNARFENGGTFLEKIAAGTATVCFFNRSGNKLVFLSSCAGGGACKPP